MLAYINLKIGSQNSVRCIDSVGKLNSLTMVAESKLSEQFIYKFYVRSKVGYLIDATTD